MKPPLIPYWPLSCGQVLAMREILPALAAWLRAREAETISHSTFRIPNSGRRPAK